VSRNNDGERKPQPASGERAEPEASLLEKQPEDASVGERMEAEALQEGQTDAAPFADETGAVVAERASTGEPDVFLHVPLVKVDEITFEVDELEARVALHAAVGDLVALDVGADVSIGRVKLEIRGVEAQALLKVRLNNVYAILARTLTTIDRNPQLLEAVLKPLGETVGAVGRTVEKAVPPLTDALGRTVEQAVPPLTGALGRTVEQAVPPLTNAVGRTVERAVPPLTDSLGKTVERTVPEVTGAVGRTAERTVPEVTGAVGRTVERTVPEVTGAVGRTALPTVPAVAAAAGARLEGATPVVNEAKRDVEPNVAALGSSGPYRPATPAKPSRPGAPSAPSAPSRPPTPSGVTVPSELESMPLFDGTDASFRRWKHVGGGSAVHDEGLLLLEAGDDLGLVYFVAQGFDDFRTRVQYRAEQGAQVGLAVRFAKPADSPEESEENQAYAVIQTGFEVHLGSQRPAVEPGTFNGVLLGKAVGAQVHPQRAEIAWGEWNEIEVTARGSEYSVRLNGKETARLTNVDASRGRRAADRSDAGYIGFLLRGGEIWIRRIELEPLAPETRAPTGEEGGRRPSRAARTHH
jgi:hypothetical protein